MALDYTAKYPGQIVPGDPAYPYGRARNDITPGDGSGTPYEEALVNDRLGFHQALLVAGGITPSETADTALASDYLAALEALYFATVRPQPLVPTQGASGSPSEIPTDWRFDATWSAWLQETSGSHLYFPITSIPAKGKLTGIRALVSGSAGASGWTTLPSSGMPSLHVEAMDISGGVSTPPTTEDPSTTLAAFNVLHEIVCTLDAPLDIDMSTTARTLWARLDGVTVLPFEASKFGILGLWGVFSR